MKTKSIILVSILNLLNSAFIVLRNLMFSADNISMSSFYIMAIAVGFVIFVPFLFSKEYRNGNIINKWLEFLSTDIQIMEIINLVGLVR